MLPNPEETAAHHSIKNEEEIEHAEDTGGV